MNPTVTSDIANGAYGYYDLARDPGEQSVLADRDSQLGKSAEAGYLGAFETMKAYAEKLTIEPESSDLPPDVKKQLDDLGY